MARSKKDIQELETQGYAGGSVWGGPPKVRYYAPDGSVRVAIPGHLSDRGGIIYDRLILQGYSLGCDRVVFYQLQTKKYYPTILISPCDSYALHTNFLKKRGLTVEQHIKIIRKYKSNKFEILPLNEYGVHNKGEDYYVPTTKDTLLSIMTGAPFKLFRLDKPLKYFLPTDCFVCIGENDTLQTVLYDNMFFHLENRFKSIYKLSIELADHEIEPHVEVLILNLVNWIKQYIGK